MGLPTLPNDELGYVEAFLVAVWGAVGIVVGAIWWVAVTTTKVRSDVETLKLADQKQDDRLEKYDQKFEAEQQRNNSRHEENLRALGKIPDIDDFRRFEDRIQLQLREIKESIAQKPH